MALSVTLYLVAKTGNKEKPYKMLEAYTESISNSLVGLAIEAELYDSIWDPGSLNTLIAGDLIEPLKKGINILISERKYFSYLEPRKKKGGYNKLLRFAEEYLAACEAYPAAKIETSK
jgi:hypothetical protein